MVLQPKEMPEPSFEGKKNGLKSQILFMRKQIFQTA